MTECSPLSWPEGWPRTPTEKQDRGWQFKRRGEGYGGRLVTFAEGRDSLYDELRKLGATSPIVTTNHPTDRYGIPTESKCQSARKRDPLSASKRDPGVSACAGSP